MGWGKRILTGIAGIGLVWGLTACSIDSEALDELVNRLMGEMSSEEMAGQSKEEDREPGGVTALPSEETALSGVLYFRDDAGKNTQLSDGWLYGYWSRRLCRVNMETMEEQVLFEALNPQAGIFCIEGDWIYFLEATRETVERRTAAVLYRMRRDGSGLEELFVMEGFDAWSGCQLDCYEDILYLTCRSAEENGKYYFKIDENGALAQAEASETLYGMLPEGLLPCEERLRFADFPRMPYCMRNWGFVLATDGENRLYRVDVASGEAEEIAFSEEPERETVFVTNDSLVYADADSVWYRRSLNDLTEVSRLGYWDCRQVAFSDEKGLYMVRRQDDSLRVERLTWTGETETVIRHILNHRLSAELYGESFSLLYSDGTYLYYDSMGAGADGVVMRVSLENPSEETQVACYYENPAKGICAYETNEVSICADNTGDKYTLTLTRALMVEDTPAAKRINAALWGEEFDLNDWMGYDRRNLWEESFSGRRDELWKGITLRERRIISRVNYLDEKYIGISVRCHDYTDGAAHGSTDTTNYVFERETGEQVKITDVVADTREEIGAVVLPFIQEKCADYREEAELLETIFQEKRLFLTAEGVGLHYDAYELGGYANGEFDFVIPWEFFTEK